MSALRWLMVWTVLGTCSVGVIQAALQQPRPPLNVAVRRLGTPTDVGRVGRLVTTVRSTGPGERLLDPAMLRLVGRRPVDQLGALVRGAVLGLCTASVAIVVAVRFGPVPLPTIPVLVVGALPIGTAVVHHRTVVEAAAARRAVRHELSAYLDVVAMLLAGDSGYEGALRQGAESGDGELFVELRRRMRDISRTGASLVEALAQAGQRFGVDELRQVAATLTISATEGAPVARSLAATCATLRASLAAEQEAEARLRTGRLTAPLVAMALIFMAVVIYPAMGR